jgi:hypothetical protein
VEFRGAGSGESNTVTLSWLSRAVAWLRGHLPELAIFLVGVLLRASMSWSYDQSWTYDADGHWAVIVWMLEHHRVPPVEAVLHAFHPPLYYATAAFLHAHGVSREGLAWVSIACGSLRLAIIWVGLELYLPASRVARLAALSLAAVLAASVHLDGMVYPEAMSGLWVAAALLLVPLAFRAPPARRWRWAAAAGVLLGLGMLTKISCVVAVGSIGAAALLEFAFSGVPWRQRVLRALPWAGMLAIILVISGWYFARNVRDYGRPFVTSFDLPSQHWLVAPVENVPVLDRRSLGFFVQWDPAVYVWPYYPAGVLPYSRFFPVAVASTFVDYWNFSFSGLDPATPAPMHDWLQNRPITPTLLTASQYAVVGGTLIFIATLAGWGFAAWSAVRRRDFGLMALLMVPALTLASALQFATAQPVDHYGVVKGVYLQFGAPPLHAAFGVAVAWASRARWRWPLFSMLLGALWLVAAYTVWCRLRLPILPLS